MKTQHLFMLVAFALFMSCSSSDDDNTEQNIAELLFIGNWQPLKFVIVCSAFVNETENLTACEQTGKLNINSNGTWSETYFYENFNDGCEEDGIDNGTWRIENGRLFVKDGGFEEVEITFFEISENTLKVGQYDNELNCRSNNTSSYFYREYVKLN